jgi:hypothetical protein
LVFIKVSLLKKKSTTLVVLWLELFREKISGGGAELLSIIWGTTTRILIIFGVPPHKYK